MTDPATKTTTHDIIQGPKGNTEQKNKTSTSFRVLSINPGIDVLCGPLLNFNGIHKKDDGTYWLGSVIIVTKPHQTRPMLRIRLLGPENPADYSAKRLWSQENRIKFVNGSMLYDDSSKTFWRFNLQLPLRDVESRWEYTIPSMPCSVEKLLMPSPTLVVPALNESMRVIFYSGNGSSAATDEGAWAGPALWNDVLRIHNKTPCHVMIGGGGQIDNSMIFKNGPLRAWVDIGDAVRRAEYLFPDNLCADCDRYIFSNYIRWCSDEPFATANSQIPQINIWDDPDIMKGFGSYVDLFSRCSVLRGLGSIAYKYYCLFQHHSAPPISCFYTDQPGTMTKVEIHGRCEDDSSTQTGWIFGTRPGPYISESSRSLYLRLGKRMAFIGVDTRTERTRRQINYPMTYEEIFSRLEFEALAADGEIKHLLFLLPTPIAYPRLAWLHSLFLSPLVGPFRFVAKRFGVFANLFNIFDGSVGFLDDIEDQYISRHHKKERLYLLQMLQAFSVKHGIRVTILGGDVHLAALGRFYSNPRLGIPLSNDHRYMVNVISSAIRNRPPPKGVADLLARRCKIHHLDASTDESMFEIFGHNPGGQKNSSDENKTIMPSRNFTVISENTAQSIEGLQQDLTIELPKSTTKGFGLDAAAVDKEILDSEMFGGLKVEVMVEIESLDSEGKTRGYKFDILPLVRK